LSWRTPNTYRKEGVERGTATSSSTRAGTTSPRLASSVERVIKRTGRKPQTVTADRGYGEAGVDDDLHDLGIRNV